MPNGMNSKKIRKRREYLWNINPHCIWCNIKTILPTKKTKGRLKKNHATLDHLYSKWNEQRFSRTDIKNTVLACHKCNWKRNEEEMKRVPIEIRRQKSGR